MLKRQEDKMKKPKYKVVVEGSMDGLKFLDLLIKYSTGYFIPLSVKKGNYIPDDPDIIDPIDLKKSLVVGTLGKFLKKGWVIDDNNQPKTKRPRRKKKIKKVEVPVTKIIPTVEEVHKETLPETPQQKVEPVKETQQEKLDLNQVTTFADFSKLGHFQKVQFIKVCKDKVLLTEITTNLPQHADQLRVHVEVQLDKLN